VSDSKPTRKKATSRTAAGGKKGSSAASANDADDDVVDEAHSMLGDATQLVEHVQAVRTEWEGRLRGLAEQRPYLSLAGATGAGFVLGGGLTVTLTRRLWLIGGRIAISLALQKLTQGSLLGSSSSDS
jgi:hypothetical protein